MRDRNVRHFYLPLFVNKYALACGPLKMYFVETGRAPCRKGEAPGGMEIV
jgi:hypothetical protein